MGLSTLILDLDLDWLQAGSGFLVSAGGRSEEFFDRATDPYEQEKLIASPRLDG